MSERYGDIGIASFESEQVVGELEIITGDTPPIVSETFNVGADVNIPAFSVVGVTNNERDGNIVLATAEGSIGDFEGAAATGTLTFTGAGVDGETVTIGARVYTLVAADPAENEVLIGATAAATAANLAAAINGDTGEGTTYGTDTVPHETVTARQTGDTVVVTAVAQGTDGNAIATTETSTVASWGAATLAGGAAPTAIRPIGITTAPVVTGAGVATTIDLWTQGCFNPDALNWHPSFHSEALRRQAFWGAPSPTNIKLQRIKNTPVSPVV